MFAQVGLKQSECRRGETEGRTAAKRIGGGRENNTNEVQDGSSRSDERRRNMLTPLDASLSSIYKVNRSQRVLASTFTEM